MTGPRILMMLIGSERWVAWSGASLSGPWQEGWSWPQLLLGLLAWLILGFVVAWMFGSLARTGASADEPNPAQAQNLSTDDRTQRRAAPRLTLVEAAPSDEASSERMATEQAAEDRMQTDSALPQSPPSVLRFDRTRRPARAQKGP